MLYRKLGNSGLDVSVLGLGTNNFGARIDEPTAARVLDQAVDIGVNCIDTANGYGEGLSEQFIGRTLKGEKRKRAVVVTKFFYGPHPNNGGTSRKHMLEALESSLRRLQTDYIDLYMLHRPEPETPIEETLRALDDVIKQGKVRYIGCCVFEAWRVVEAAWTAKSLNLHHFAAAQNHYNMLTRNAEVELVPACVATGTSLMPYYPLEAGILTGKYHPGAPPPPGSRMAGGSLRSDDLDAGNLGRVKQMEGNVKLHATEANLLKVQALHKWAEARGRSVGELAHAWLLANPAVDTVISGATRPEQVVENAKGTNWVLSAKELEEIEKLNPR